MVILYSSTQIVSSTIGSDVFYDFWMKKSKRTCPRHSEAFLCGAGPDIVCTQMIILWRSETTSQLLPLVNSIRQNTSRLICHTFRGFG